MQALASKWAMSSGVLKWYGSLMITLFKFVGFKQILSFKLPDLSLPSTRTKLLTHGVASCTGFNTPTCSILLNSCWKASFRWTGIGQQGVCFGVTLGSSCIWYGGPGNLPIPSKTSGKLLKICSLLVTSLGTSSLGTIVFPRGTLLSVVELWTAIWHLVFLGWSTEFVIKLALGGK